MCAIPLVFFPVHPVNTEAFSLQSLEHFTLRWFLLHSGWDRSLLPFACVSPGSPLQVPATVSFVVWPLEPQGQILFQKTRRRSEKLLAVPMPA